MNIHPKEQAEKYNVQIIHMGQFDYTMQCNFYGFVYVSVNFDPLDPVFAPGVSHTFPGGLSNRFN